jgi:phosphoenolpyruvate carboxykinase (GTP)
MMPSPADLDLTGLTLSSQALEALLAIDPAVWAREMDDIEGFSADFGPRMPLALHQQVDRIRQQIGPQQAA